MEIIVQDYGLCMVRGNLNYMYIVVMYNYILTNKCMLLYLVAAVSY